MIALLSAGKRGTEAGAVVACAALGSEPVGSQRNPACVVERKGLHECAPPLGRRLPLSARTTLSARAAACESGKVWPLLAAYPIA